MAHRQKLVVSFLAVVILCAPMCSVVLGIDKLDWGVERIRAYCAWDNDNWNVSNWNTSGIWDVDPGPNNTNNAGQNVIVAIIDTGMDYTVDSNNTVHVHPDLADNMKGMAGFFYNSSSGNVDVYTNATSDQDYIRDYYFGHGTEVSGVIAASINGIGVIGVSPNVSLYSLKLYSLISPNANYAQEEEAARAITYSVDTLHAQIISISIGWDVSFNNEDLDNSCQYAINSGVLVITAAGDLNSTELGYPADYGALAVGATDHNDARATFSPPFIASNYGPRLWLMAPGVDINTTTLNQGYTEVYGTSFAAPFVSATAALVWASKIDPSYGSEWTAGTVGFKIQSTTLDLGVPGRDNNTGYGLVNAWLPLQRPIGDINLDGKVEIRDLAILGKAYGTSPGMPLWDPRADINIDNKVDIRDQAILTQHWQQVDP